MHQDFLLKDFTKVQLSQLSQKMMKLCPHYHDLILMFLVLKLRKTVTRYTQKQVRLWGRSADRKIPKRLSKFIQLAILHENEKKCDKSMKEAKSFSKKR